jgi:L-lactate dehydrogenase complex protein LldG
VVEVESVSARAVVLARIRAALADSPPDTETVRGYRTESALDRGQLVERFAERLSEYRAVVRTVAADLVEDGVADTLEKRGATRIVIPESFEQTWLPPGLKPLREPLSNEDLDRSEGVLTTCRLAVAETGTIILDGGPGQGRRALTLLPDYHLCVVRVEQIVGSVVEAVRALDAEMRQAPRPLTFISGPSATSDIEFRRVEGVHGPRTLEVLIVV